MRAGSTGNYHVTQKQGKKTKTLPVQSASYSNNVVTLMVAGFKTGSAQATITGLVGAKGAGIAPITTGL